MKRLVLMFAVLLQATLIFGQNIRGASEVFIEIPDRGNYVVYLDNEFAGSAKGRFRFYEVSSTFPTVVVMKDNIEIFRKRINIQMNTRLLASYSSRTGWRNIGTLNLYDRGQYALDNWDRTINNNNRPDPGQGSGYQEAMTPEEHTQLLNLIKRDGFSDGQMKIAKAALKNSMVTTDQLMAILKLFTFDDKKLELAKYAYPSVLDRRNFIKLAGAFNFLMAKQDFIDFASKQ